jgi:hypothetical protein
MRRMAPIALLAAVLLAGCGGSSKSHFPVVGAAKTYALVDFAPSSPPAAGTPTKVSFVIRQPDGKPLTAFRRGPGPHTGVHVIFVRRDLATIVHRHPPISSQGVVGDTVTFAEPGPYRMVVDVYPSAQRNFQLFGSLRVAGPYTPRKLPAPESVADVAGYRFTIHGRPKLHAIQAGILPVTVVDPRGAPARFTTWYGALAHAIFFRRGTLDYFHTHVCAPGAGACTSSASGATTVVGTSTTPGQLRVGVLLPTPGTWRLFLQCRVGGQILTAPFTLAVRQ